MGVCLVMITAWRSHSLPRFLFTATSVVQGEGAGNGYKRGGKVLSRGMKNSLFPPPAAPSLMAGSLNLLHPDQPHTQERWTAALTRKQ